jgi:hypothetical protein
MFKKAIYKSYYEDVTLKEGIVVTRTKDTKELKILVVMTAKNQTSLAVMTIDQELKDIIDSV